MNHPYAPQPLPRFHSSLALWHHISQQSAPLPIVQIRSNLNQPASNVSCTTTRLLADPGHTNRATITSTPSACPQQDSATDLRAGIDPGDPLTAKGRIKKRLREKDSFDPEDPDRYRYKSYHLRRAFDLYGHLPTIINDGIKRRAKESMGEDASAVQSDREYETFQLIMNHLEGLNDEIYRLKRNPKAFRALIRKIREAADQARNNDTASLKKDIACMLTADGSSVLTVVMKGKKTSSKHDRGFENEVMGRHLCPISLDWDNPIVRAEIKEGQHAILASDWPRLLYANCECNLDDLEAGLGRNMALVRVVKYLFTGRSAAFSETAGGKTTRSGNAALAGMKEITPRVVAYAACMLRYAISNEESWTTIDKEFHMEEFYWHVVSIFDDSEDFGKDLLSWWNMKVFGTSIETSLKPDITNTTAALSLLRKQRQAKRTAKPVLSDVTNRMAVPEDTIDTTESEDDEVHVSTLTAPIHETGRMESECPSNDADSEVSPASPSLRIAHHTDASPSPSTSESEPKTPCSPPGSSNTKSMQNHHASGYSQTIGTAPASTSSADHRPTTPSALRAYADALRAQPNPPAAAYYPQIQAYHMPPPGMPPMMYRPIPYGQIGVPPPPPWTRSYTSSEKVTQSSAPRVEQ